jgi:hypothetical protein
MAFGLGEALSIGSSIAGGLFGDDANEDAANAIGKSNAQIQKMIADQQEQNYFAYRPYSKVGELGNNRLATLLGLENYTRDRYANNPAAEAEVERIMRDKVHRLGYDEETARGQVEKGWGLTPTYSSNKDDAEFGSLLRKFGQSDLDSDTVYNTGLEFGLNEGVKGLNRRAASGGSYDSGATLKALTRYANDYGTTKAEGAYNRFMNDKATTYGFLSGQQGVGLNATNASQSLSNNLLNSAINSQSNAGVAQAQYGLQGAQALNNGIMGGIGNYLYSNRMGSGGINGGTPGINGAAGYPGYTYGSSSAPWYA